MSDPSAAAIELRLADTPDDLVAVRALFLDYQASLDVDLCFQGFAHEVDNWPWWTARPPDVVPCARCTAAITSTRAR